MTCRLTGLRRRPLYLAMTGGLTESLRRPRDLVMTHRLPTTAVHPKRRRPSAGLPVRHSRRAKTRREKRRIAHRPHPVIARRRSRRGNPVPPSRCFSGAAKKRKAKPLDCRVAALLAMTAGYLDRDNGFAPREDARVTWIATAASPPRNDVRVTWIATAASPPRKDKDARVTWRRNRAPRVSPTGARSQSTPARPGAEPPGRRDCGRQRSPAS